ncbi:MAG: hypothetical protein AAGC54_10790, partial [Cyanobacteria bacterium P01_F01_bin.4]
MKKYGAIIIAAVQWFDRVRLTGLVGLLALMMSLRYAWYHLPTENLAALQIGSLPIPLGKVFSASILVWICRLLWIGATLKTSHHKPPNNPLRHLLWVALS